MTMCRGLPYQRFRSTQLRLDFNRIKVGYKIMLILIPLFSILYPKTYPEVKRCCEFNWKWVVVERYSQTTLNDGDDDDDNNDDDEDDDDDDDDDDKGPLTKNCVTCQK